MSEDDVMAYIVLKPGESVSFEEIITFCNQNMSYFMVPRFIRIMEELPKTPTLKIQKHILRNEGITTDSWDREKAGIRIKKEKLSDA